VACQIIYEALKGEANLLNKQKFKMCLTSYTLYGKYNVPCGYLV
jgi:hypothetical protein